MALEGGLLLPAFHVPQPNRLVPPTDTTSQGLTIPGKRYRIDRPRMALEGGLLLPAFHIPQPYRLVMTATGQGLTIR